MKKTGIFILLFCIALLASCNKNVSTHDISQQSFGNVSVESQTQISEQEALDILKSKIGTNNDTRKFEIDGEKIMDGHEYYFIHVYTESVMSAEKAEEEGIGMTFTYGWYLVDKYTKEVFDVTTDKVSVE